MITHHTNRSFQCRPFKINYKHQDCPVSGSNVFIILTFSNNTTCSYKYKIKNSNEHFSTGSPEEPILCNIIISISDLLAQFLLYSIEKTKGSMHKEICKWNFKSLTSNELIEDLKSIECCKALRLNQRQTNKSFKLFSTILNPFQTLTQQAHHIESTSIPRGYYADTLQTKFQRISTSFPRIF